MAIKSFKEKCEKRKQLAKVNGEKDIGGSSTVTLPPSYPQDSDLSTYFQLFLKLIQRMDWVCLQWQWLGSGYPHGLPLCKGGEHKWGKSTRSD